MKTKIIIGLFTLIGAATFSFSPANAAKNNPIPATHMWILTGNAVVHVHANSLEQCEMLTRQASKINSSEADCYNGEEFLKRINCQKNPTDQNNPRCTVK